MQHMRNGQFAVRLVAGEIRLSRVQDPRYELGGGFVSGDLAGARVSLISTSVVVIAPAIAMGIAVVE